MTVLQCRMRNRIVFKRDPSLCVVPLILLELSKESYELMCVISVGNFFL